MNRKLFLSLSLASLLLTSTAFAEDTAAKNTAAATSTTTTATTDTATTGSTHVAGGTLREVDVAMLGTVVTGWSAHKQLLGKDVYNEKDDKVGDIKDIIIAPDRSVTYAIVGVGGFLGMGEHDIAIDSKYFSMQGDKILLDGATKDLLKQVPEFKYAEQK